MIDEPCPKMSDHESSPDADSCSSQKRPTILAFFFCDKSIFPKIYKEKIQFASLLQILHEFIIHSKVIAQTILDPDDSMAISSYECVKHECCLAE